MKKRIRVWFPLGLALSLMLASGALDSIGAPGTQSSPQQQQAPQANQPNPANPPQNQSGAPNSSAPGPSLKNPPGSAPATPQVGPEESQAYLAIQKELDPDKQLQLVKDFEKKYPNSSLLSDIDFFGASASEQKNDVGGALNYGARSLKLRPDNLRSLILVASLLPLPQALQGTAQQKEQQLDQSENDANHALQLLGNLHPGANVPPDQFKKSKGMIEAQLHAALGMAHLQKAITAPGTPNAAELASAEQEFKTAVASPQPNPQDYYRLGEVFVRENKLDEAVSAFTQAAQLGQGTMIQQYANNMIQRLKAQKAKNSNPPPAKH